MTQEGSRLRHYIRRRVRDSGDVEDILQDVFAELVEANRLLMPIEHVTAWLFRVARNRITDLFRKKRPVLMADGADVDDDVPGGRLDDLLPSPDAGPDALLARQWMVFEIEAALAELPSEQRAAFVGHAIDGRSFKEMAADTGTNVNTLLSRKHSAVRRLRRRLRALHDELGKDTP